MEKPQIRGQVSQMQPKVPVDLKLTTEQLLKCEEDRAVEKIHINQRLALSHWFKDPSWHKNGDRIAEIESADENHRNIRLWLKCPEMGYAEGSDSVLLARKIFARANCALKASGETQSRALLLEAWKTFEKEKGDRESLAEVIEKMPRRIIKRRRTSIGSEDGYEEKMDFVFPEDEKPERPNSKS